MRVRRYFPFITFFLSIGILLAISTGCRNQLTQEALLPTASTSTLPGERAGDKVTYTFGIIYPMAHSFYEMITEYAEDAARSRQVRLIVKAPDEANLEQQIWMVETMIKQKVDGIAIDPIDADALAPVINKAVASGIPVICFESDAPDSNRATFIGTDNKHAGAIMGQSIEKLLGGSGMVLVQTGMSSMRNQNERLEGMLTYLNERTQVQVLEVSYNEGKENRSLRELETMIDQHPHFDAFVALDFISGSTSVLVWKAKGLTRYAVTYGLTSEMEEAMVNGQITSVISQNEKEWGDKIVDSLVKVANKEPIPTLVDTGVTEITSKEPSKQPFTNRIK